jgi:hypothetical protein
LESCSVDSLAEERFAELTATSVDGDSPNQAGSTDGDGGWDWPVPVVEHRERDEQRRRGGIEAPGKQLERARQVHVRDPATRGNMSIGLW